MSLRDFPSAPVTPVALGPADGRASAPSARARRVLSETEAAEYLSASTRSLQRWRMTGEGPAFVRLGARRVGYAVDALDAWLSSRTFSSTSSETVAKRCKAA